MSQKEVTSVHVIGLPTVCTISFLLSLEKSIRPENELLFSPALSLVEDLCPSTMALSEDEMRDVVIVTIPQSQEEELSTTEDQEKILVTADLAPQAG